jgi:hypothetical protein
MKKMGKSASYTYKTLPDNTALHNGEQVHFKIDGTIGYFTYGRGKWEGPFGLPPSYANEPISGKVLSNSSEWNITDLRSFMKSDELKKMERVLGWK